MIYIYIKQIKSLIRISKKNKIFLKSLGLKKNNDQIFVKNTKHIKNLLLKTQHLIKICFINKL